jgi:hypothetical protein
MTPSNGESEAAHGPLEISEKLHIKTHEGMALEFEVVGILEDPYEGASYAVLYREPSGNEEEQFIVTDPTGTLLADERLAQEILDDFLAAASENDEHAANNGDPS